MQNKHIRLATGCDYRLVIISDIHAHETVFQDLLKKVNLNEDDYLVILGDFINKGPENMAVLKLVMSLNKRKRTYILKGNHEGFVISSVQSEVEFAEMLAFLKQDPYELILHDMAKVIEFDLYNCQNSEIFRQALLQHFEEELDFIATRPVLLENESFILVHGGYEKEFCPERDEIKLLKYDFFNEKSPVQDKTIIVGHWPACNLRNDIMTNLPFFNNEKKIITIDGGLGVKSSGELNAFIITSKDGDVSYEVIQSNNYVERVVTKTIKLPEEELIFINYPHFDIEILERGPQFTKCRHLHSGKICSVFNSLLYKEGDKDYINTVYINRFFNPSLGDKVEICKIYEDCVHVKYNDEFGWILPAQIE
ncbi:metallophosphoesterase [Fusibacter bizertensis]